MSKQSQIWYHFFSLLFPRDSENLKSLDIWLWEVGAKRFLKGMNNWKKICKTFFHRSNFSPFMSKSFQLWDPFFPLLFLKDSENLKSLDIGLWEVGAKRRTDRQTNRRTYGHVDYHVWKESVWRADSSKINLENTFTNDSQHSWACRAGKQRMSKTYWHKDII